MKKLFSLLLIILFLTTGLAYAGLTGEDILKKVDDNYVADNRKASATMIIKGARGVRTLKSLGWVQGTNKSFTEFIFPARDKGTKMLKLYDKLWIYSPSTDRIIEIAGHMLRQSMMGSDVSYEDYMEDPRLVKVYNVKLAGEEKVNDRLCYVLKLTAKKDDVAYHSRRMWVDKERFLPLKEERYAKSGKLLKRMTIEEVFYTQNRWYPKKMVFKDMMQSGDGTTLIIDDIKFNVNIPDYIFSKAALKK
ncbi:MAG: outer membrane lipoprotein-sorting protein [Armatimonadota bacterium]